jgi:CxxC motif-containing protein (DUF1111 family)
VSNHTVQDLVFYLQTLKAPIPRHEDDAEVIEGRQVFANIGCDKCHTPELTTGEFPITALSKKKFFPFSDFLLHDMGPSLDDGYTEGMAHTSEWRTPALWGLGLSKNSQGGNYFLMHDGRAHTIEEAIMLHGGEAESSRSMFQDLGASQKSKLIKFLESL